jgi:hypothetical protein
MMKLKALSALLLTVVLSLAALASEQRRLHCDISVGGETITVATREINATN